MRKANNIGPAIQIEIHGLGLNKRRRIDRARNKPSCQIPGGNVRLAQEQEWLASSREQKQIGLLIVIGVEDECAVPGFSACQLDRIEMETQQAIVQNSCWSPTVGQHKEVDVAVGVQIRSGNGDDRPFMRSACEPIAALNRQVGPGGLP